MRLTQSGRKRARPAGTVRAGARPVSPLVGPSVPYVMEAAGEVKLEWLSVPAPRVGTFRRHSRGAALFRAEMKNLFHRKSSATNYWVPHMSRKPDTGAAKRTRRQTLRVPALFSADFAGPGYAANPCRRTRSTSAWITDRTTEIVTKNTSIRKR